MSNITGNREQWLHRALPVLMQWLADAGVKPFPVPHLSFGMPARGLSKNPAKRAIAECWPRRVTQLQDRNVIHISPVNAEPVSVLACLFHELIHASDDCASKHRGHFKVTALAVGFEGPMRSTPAGPQLKIALEKLAKDLGPLDHDPMVNIWTVKKKKKRTRTKYECPECGHTISGPKEWAAVHLCDGTPKGKKAIYVVADEEEGDEE